MTNTLNSSTKVNERVSLDVNLQDRITKYIKLFTQLPSISLNATFINKFFCIYLDKLLNVMQKIVPRIS